MRKTNRSIALLLVLLMLIHILPVYDGVAADGLPAADTQINNIGIDYSISDIIVTGKINGVENSGYYINLTKEKLVLPDGYSAAAYSINGGNSWTSVSSKSVFDSAALVKLLTKDINLVLTDKYDGKKRAPATDAIIVKFDKINKRPKLPDYTVNYLIGADTTGATTGTWVLTMKNGTSSVKEGIEVAAATADGKTADSNGYGKFYGEDGSTNGIQIVPMKDGKQVNSAYYIRTAPKSNGDGTYTAASTSTKITVKGQPKPPSYSVDKKNKKVKYGANTRIYQKDEAELKTASGDIAVSGSDADTVYLQTAATASAPASAWTGYTLDGDTLTFDNPVPTLTDAGVIGIAPMAGIITNIIIVPSNTQVKSGDYITLTAYVWDDENNPMDTSSLLWSITSGTHAIISPPGFGPMATVTGTGTPAAAGSPVTITATLGNVSQSVGITVFPADSVLPPELIMTPNGGPLTDGEIGMSYSANITVTGGPNTGNYIWSISQHDDGTGNMVDDLPPGLRFDNGAISGTPTGTGGAYGFSVTVKKGTPGVDEVSITRAFSITVHNTFSITFGVESGVGGEIVARNLTDQGIELRKEPTTANSFNMLIRMSSTVYFTATPNPGYYIKEWRKADGSNANLLPGDKVTINSVDYTSAEYNVTNLTSGITVQVVFAPIPPKITTDTLPNGKKNYTTPYLANLDATGTLGTRKWTWGATNPSDSNMPTGFIPSGVTPPSTPPPGLALNTNGTITGIPTESGTYYLTVTLEDLNSDDTVRTSVKKYLILTILNEIAVTYKVDGAGTGTITAASDDHYAVISTSADKSTITINTWQGDGVTFTAMPDEGCTVGKWTYNPATNIGIESNDVNNTVFTSRIGNLQGVSGGVGSPNTLEVTVTFSPLQTSLVRWSAGAGAGSLEAKVNNTIINDTEYFLPPGQSITFTATPGAGYRVLNWETSDDGSAYTDLGITGNSYTLRNPTIKEVWVRVNFTQSSPAQIDILPNDTMFLPEGTIGGDYSFVFDVTDKTNYAILNWTWDWGANPAPSGLTLNPLTGEIEGTIPTEYPAGTTLNSGNLLTFSVKVTGTLKTGGTSTRTKTYSILLLAPVLPVIITDVLPLGAKDYPYNEQIQCTGSKPVTWTLVSVPGEGLPNGLALNTATGEITGTPTETGTFTFTVTAANAATAPATSIPAPTKKITVTIEEPKPPTITTGTTLPKGKVGAAYSQIFVATGNPSVFTWSISAGTLPPGLALNPVTGEITGTPTTAGTYNFTIRSNNGVNPAATKQIQIVIDPFVIEPTPPANGEVGIAYSHQFNTIAGVTWRLSPTGGILPPGLTLSTSGLISGTPTQAGANNSYTFEVISTYGGVETKKSFTIKITGPILPKITTQTLEGVEGIHFDHSLSATGTMPFTWTMTGGTLPPGLVFSNGRISGIPTAAGIYYIDVEASNVAGTDTITVIITIAPPYAPTIIRPVELNDGPYDSKLPGGSQQQSYLANGTMNKQYNESLLTKGFEDDKGIIPPIYWNIIGGTLPPGLNLTQWVEGVTQPPTSPLGSDTGAARAGCAIEGAPTRVGTGKLYTFIVEANEIVRYQRGTTIVWEKEGAADWITANPGAEKYTWVTGSVTCTVILSGKKATRTFNILITSEIYVPVTGITISPATIDVPLNQTSTLTANIAPTDASIRTVTWQTSNSTVATVDQSGNVRGNSEGTAIITAVTSDGSYVATREVRVVTVYPTAISVDRTTITLPVGGTDKIKPTLTPTNTTDKTVTFDSNKLDVATVDEYGNVTALKIGTATITITAKSVNSGTPVSRNVTIKVVAATPVPATDVQINKTFTRLIVGESEVLTTTILPANATNKAVRWKSSNSTYVSVDSVTGRITARKPTTGATTGTGTSATPLVVVVTATVKNQGTDDDDVFATIIVDVDERVPIDGVTLNKNMTNNEIAIIPVNMSEMLVATILPINSNEYERDLIWRSIDTNIATVDEKGNVKGVSVGTTIVEVGTSNGMMDSCIINVVPLAATVQRFVDVNSSSWYFQSVNQAETYGLVKGVGNSMYAPERNVTRAEFVQMIVNAMNPGTLQWNPPDFSADVVKEVWYHDAIQRAGYAGLLDKFENSNNRFYPTRAIKREEMAVILAAAAKYYGINGDPSNTLVFKDAAMITAEYRSDVNLVSQIGLMIGDENENFNPQNVATRAEAATVMVRFYHEIARVKGSSFAW